MTPEPSPGGVHLRVEGGVGWITIERAPAHPEELSSLDAALDACRADRSVRVLVVRGSAPGALDGKGLGPRGDVARHGQDVLHGLATSGRPSLAVLEGTVTGCGLELALACHARIAASDATLGFPEARSGALPAMGGLARLPRLVGPGRALDLLLGGGCVSARRAELLGLVDEVAKPEAVAALARERALAWAAVPEAALRGVAEAVTWSADLAIDDALRLESGLDAHRSEAGGGHRGEEA